MHSLDIASSPWPLTDLGQNVEMPKMKNFFFKGNELNFYPAPVLGLKRKHSVIATNCSPGEQVQHSSSFRHQGPTLQRLAL